MDMFINSIQNVDIFSGIHFPGNHCFTAFKGEVQFENKFSKIGLFSFVFTYKTFLRKQFVISAFSYFPIAC